MFAGRAFTSAHARLFGVACSIAVVGVVATQKETCLEGDIGTSVKQSERLSMAQR
jgi:hypothetical protein